MAAVKVLSLGGLGKVTQNMYVYMYEDEILIVDCGIGFPDVYTPGVDVMIPDITYLLNKLEEGMHIAGMILTHGHDDHIAALPYILPQLPEFPIYGSPLTAGFASQRMVDGSVQREITVIRDHEVYQVGQYFSFESLAVTHSVPDTKHFAIRTPEGMIYHGTDFKIDKHPVDGVTVDTDRIKELGEEGVLCMLLDCLRVERSEWVPSESTVGPVIDRLVGEAKGKAIVTMMSSHIHRIQQTVDSAHKHGRKIAFVGRSVEQNVKTALELKLLQIPEGTLIDKEDIENTADKQLCIIVAGSQGQEGSSLVRAVFGEHPMIKISADDSVIFSADAIPGNEIPYYAAIDELSRNGINVLYPNIVDDLHESGHGSAEEQKEMVKLIKPKYALPIGGADRHRVLFTSRVAEQVGMSKDQVLLPLSGEVLEFENGTVHSGELVSLKMQAVDGLGVGDVGPKVLADRRNLSEAGIIVLIIPRIQGQLDLGNIHVVSRGFVFMRDAGEVIKYIQERTAEIVNSLQKPKDDEVKRAIEKRLARSLYKIIRREPIILPVIVEL